MKKILIAFVFFLLGVVLFMPKINLYYTLENILEKEHIVIKEGALQDRWVDLSIKDAVIFYDGIASVEAADITITPWIFYHKVTMHDVHPTAAIANMFNAQADEVVLKYSVLDYKHVVIEAVGDFGRIDGTLDIKEQKIHLLLEPSETFKHNTLVREYFKKREEGLVYESKL
jgi:predicted nucleic-acid-binding protein